MLKKRLFTPTIAILFSIIPGLTFWIFYKRRQAAILWIALALTVICFILIPSLIIWYLICILYLGQMIYSARLAVWQRSAEGAQNKSINANLAIPLPMRFKNSRQLDQAVSIISARAIRPDHDLVTNILGLDQDSTQYKFYIVTENDLIIADCTDRGELQISIRISKAEVAWVSLMVAERNCLMTIRYEEDHYSPVTLHIPGKLKKQAIQFVNEFPGTWYSDPSSNEVFASIHKLGWRPQNLIIGLISGGFVLFGLMAPSDNAALLFLKTLSYSFGFFWSPGLSSFGC